MPTAGICAAKRFIATTGTIIPSAKWWDRKAPASAACAATTIWALSPPIRGPRGSYASSMIRAEQLWKFVKVHDYVIGDFMWTGIDYLGESRWPGKSSASAACWTRAVFPRTAIISIKANGRRNRCSTYSRIGIGKAAKARSSRCFATRIAIQWNCSSTARASAQNRWSSRAKARRADGTAMPNRRCFQPPPICICPGTCPTNRARSRPLATKTARKCVPMKSPQPANRRQSPCRPIAQQCMADARDVAHFTVKVVDAQGNTVPTADSLITFDLQGPGVIIGVDNGNPASHEDYKAKQRKAFNGLCLAIVQATNEQGKIRLTARSEGLKEATLEIDAKSAATASMSNQR